MSPILTLALALAPDPLRNPNLHPFSIDQTDWTVIRGVRVSGPPGVLGRKYILVP